VESIPINLAVEDPLSEAVLRAILRQSNRPYELGTCYCQGGYGYLKKTMYMQIIEKNYYLTEQKARILFLHAIGQLYPFFDSQRG